jgi:hypothetical protein
MTANRMRSRRKTRHQISPSADFFENHATVSCRQIFETSG